MAQHVHDTYHCPDCEGIANKVRIGMANRLRASVKLMIDEETEKLAAAQNDEHISPEMLQVRKDMLKGAQSLARGMNLAASWMETDSTDYKVEDSQDDDDRF